jgi:ATP-dependent DNA helicase RecG
MAEAGLGEPVFESNLFFTVRFPLVPGSAHERTSLAVKSGAKSGTKSGTKSQQMAQRASILQLCETPQSLVKLMASFDRSDRTKFRQSVIDPLIEAGWIARTVPDRARSRFQQYVTTPAGRKQLNRYSQEWHTHSTLNCQL